MKKFLLSTLIALILFVLFINIIKPINLTNSDIGRHIKNGELVLQGEKNIFFENHYSFTEPKQRFVNHHWAFGVLMYWLHDVAGFSGISWFYLGLLMISFMMALIWGLKRSRLGWLCLLALAAVPLIANRVEIRPEGFSGLFLVIDLIILFSVRESRASSRWLFIIPFIQMAWVNIHVFFIVLLVMLVVFWIDAKWIQGNNSFARRIEFIFLACVMASCANPNGIDGLLHPLNVFKEFGYSLAENQTVFFMEKRFPDLLIYSFYIYLWLPLGLACWVCVFFRRAWKDNILNLIIITLFLAGGIKAVRLMSIASLITFPLIAQTLSSTLGKYKRREFGILTMALTILLLDLALFADVPLLSPWKRLKGYIPVNEQSNNHFLSLSKPQYWTGILPYGQRSAEFISKLNIQGPIFNNYDFGGYVIYKLFPQHQPFVDNRWEAFSPRFFKDVYIPMQEDEDFWKKQDEKYDFNVIYFYRRDFTPWAQPFLIKRIEDKAWAPVYSDPFTIILLKRNRDNSAIIKRFEMPMSAFQIEKNN